MLNKLKKTNNQGFTIIEVMIVLAIAALILLIVLLAVPALQRNARNTSRRNDVAALLAGVNEYVTNNQGTLPGSCGPAAGGSTVTWGAAGTTTSETKVGYYNQGCSTTAGVTSGQIYLLTCNGTASCNNVTAPGATSADYVQIVKVATCNGNALATGGSRSMAALYQVENGSARFATVCTAS